MMLTTLYGTSLNMGIRGKRTLQSEEPKKGQPLFCGQPFITKDILNYFLFLLDTAARPTRPVPKSNIVAGSGTAFMSSM